jgi:hypothetical protein
VKLSNENKTRKCSGHPLILNPSPLRGAKEAGAHRQIRTPPILIINFNDLTKPAFLSKSGLIDTRLNSTTGTLNFPLPWPKDLPTPADVHAGCLTYQAACSAAASGDKNMMLRRTEARKALTGILKRIAPYLELVANGSVPLCESTGYDLRQDSNVHNTPDPLPAPDGFTCVRGPLSGTVIIGCAALHGAGSYKSQICLGDPTVAANWVDSLTFKNCSHNTIPSLPVGQTVSVRLCGIGASTQGAWTNAISLMIA